MKSRRHLQILGVSLIAVSMFVAACGGGAAPTPTAAPAKPAAAPVATSAPAATSAAVATKPAAATTAPAAASTVAPAAATTAPAAPTAAPVAPTAAPAAAVPTKPSAAAGAIPVIAHPIAGQENCTQCHQVGGAGVGVKGGTGIPASHQSYTDAQCQGCHKPA